MHGKLLRGNIRDSLKGFLLKAGQSDQISPGGWREMRKFAQIFKVRDSP